MRQFIVALLVLLSGTVAGQTTITSGDWTDPTVWNSGVIPTTTSTVVVNHPLDILSNLTPGNGGDYTFNANATDQPGGTAYYLLPNHDNAFVTVASGVTVTFTGGSTWQGGDINIYGTLIIGDLTLVNDAALNVYIRSGGTLIINGNLTNNNNSGALDVAGSLVINGNYDGGGSTQLTGAGSLSATGTISSGGSSTVFGSGNDCTVGPCSGSTLTCTFANAISPASATLCSPGSTTLTANNTGTTPTYLWQSSTDNVSYATATGTSNASTYSVSGITASTWYRVQKTVSGCTSTSAAVKITILSGGGWKGISDDWGTGTNWCSGSAPSASTDVVITNSAGIAFLPVINAGTGAVCNNLTISNTSPASSVTIAAAANASLSISGNFTNNGTFTDNSTAAAAGLKFVGTAQTLSGNAIAVNNLTIANTTLNASSANITVNNNLTFTSGIVNMNGYTLRLGTSTSSIGTLNYTAGHMYNGNFQRWYPTAAVSLGAAALFPVGGPLNYRTMYLPCSGLTASGGTIKVSHTLVLDASTVSFSDGATPVTRRSNSFWTVTPNGLSSTGTPFAMRTDAENIGTVGNVLNIRIVLAASAAPGSNGTSAGTTTIPQVNRTGLSVANLTNNFYWGSTDATVTPLPVVLRSFDGTFSNNEVELTWKTESEHNSDYFSVWHSADGEQFKEIGQVKGLGTSSTGKTYTLMHNRPARGINYYQLRQVDFDQTETAYQVIRVEADPSAEFLTIYPNPVQSAATLTIDMQLPAASGAVDISVIDMSGRPLLQFTGHSDAQGSVNYSFDTSELAPGMYILRAGSAKRLFFVK